MDELKRFEHVSASNSRLDDNLFSDWKTRGFDAFLPTRIRGLKWCRKYINLLTELS
jgi:hypothetical protein